MKLLLFNPNTSIDLTDRMAGLARAAVSTGTEIVALTGHRGVPYIATRAEAAVGAMVVLEGLAALSEPVDAAVIAAFGDPGVGAAREMMDFPVIGLAEASMLTACMLGRRFAIVSFSQALGPWYRECVDYNRLGDRLASIRLLDAPFTSISNVHEEKEEALVALCRQAVAIDHADVLILAGAPLAGLAPRIRDRVDVPVIDGIAAAARQAELLASLRPRKARAGTFRRPDAKTSTGLTPELEKLFRRDRVGD